MSFNFYKNKACTANPPAGTSPIKCTPLEPAKCMRYLYCQKVRAEAAAAGSGTSTGTTTTIVNRDQLFLDRVDPPKCVKNPVGVLLGLYDGDTKDYSSLTGLPKVDYLSSTVNEKTDCDEYVTGAPGSAWEGVVTPKGTTPGEKDFCNFDIQKITLYIIAEHEVS